MRRDVKIFEWMDEQRKWGKRKERRGRGLNSEWKCEKMDEERLNTVYVDMGNV